MKINQDACIRCQSCVIYCPADAIKIFKDSVNIDQDHCLECGACLRSGACKFNALYQPELKWPRALRGHYSDPLGVHPSTGISGRGTVEMKTNDVTGRFREDEVGIAVEIGRPGVGTSFAEVEKLTVALANLVDFEPLNPLTTLIDIETGKFKDPAVKNERVLSTIIECKTDFDDAIKILKVIKDKSKEADTVYTICVINKCNDYSIPFKKRLEEEGFNPGINGKINVGLGRPLA
jgi:NAD-dependent dihydropyrimidine dehydrogenase PreA subunit